MATYVHNGTAFQELTGTDQPFVNVAGAFQGVKNVYVHNSGSWNTVYEYDITGPTISTPTVVNATTSHTVSWTGISDNASGLTSATLYQRFVGSTSGDVAGSSFLLLSFGAGSTSFGVPLNRRKQGNGESWSAYYYIVAVDAAGNTSTGNNSTSMATTAYDIVSPTIDTLSAVDTTSALNTDTGMQRVTWGAITDDNSGIASAILSRWFYSYDSNFNTIYQAEETHNIYSYLNGSYLDLSVPLNRRRQTNDTSSWFTHYRVTVVDVAGNSKTIDAAGYQTSLYDNTGPVVPTLSRTTSGSMSNATQTDTVSWKAITDNCSGVTSATIYQLYYGSTNGTTSGFVAGESKVLSSFGSSSTTFSIPTNRRQVDGGLPWSVTYYIIAVDNAGNSTTGTAFSAQTTLRYDITGPVVPTPNVPVVTGSGTEDYVEWSAATDAGSGVTSVIIYQTFTGSISGTVSGSFFDFSPFGLENSGFYTFGIPPDKRNTPTGETWRVKYRIVAVDAAGNSTTGAYSENRYTKPKGDYMFVPTGADARNIGNTAWLNQTTADEGMVGFSTTKAYGAYFYGSTAFSNKTHGWKPDSGSIWLQRPGSAQTNKGNSGTFSIRAHTSPTKSGALSYVGDEGTIYISGNDGTGMLSLSSNTRKELGDGTAYGFALTGHSTTLAFLRGLTVSTNNNTLNIHSGTVFLTYT